MKIAILGNGYVGTELAKSLRTRHDFVVIGRNDLNYHDPFILAKWIAFNKISHVIGAFGFTGRPNIDEAETKKKECWHLNVTVPMSVNRVCADMKIPFLHVSSGCIYTGYEKTWNENDDPNFGMFDDSSFYSKTKHAFEMVSSNLPGVVLRIRMPFGNDLNSRSLLTKLLKYDRLIDMKNSKTYIPNLCEAICRMIDSDMIGTDCRKTYHMVNPKPLMTSDVVREMRTFGIYNPNWSFVPLDQIPIVAPRSNCIIETIHTDNPFLTVEDELTVLRKSLKIMKETP
jgi:dTDP-4-dehydrorhamnose reductase